MDKTVCYVLSNNIFIIIVNHIAEQCEDDEEQNERCSNDRALIFLQIVPDFAGGRALFVSSSNRALRNCRILFHMLVSPLTVLRLNSGIHKGVQNIYQQQNDTGNDGCHDNRASNRLKIARFNGIHDQSSNSRPGEYSFR